MTTPRDFDLIVVGTESEACLSAIAAQRAGARTALVVPAGELLGGLLTQDGLAFVDRDSRHLLPPDQSPQDGLFGQFLARSGVPLVALDPRRGDSTLRSMLQEAGVTVVHATWRQLAVEGDRAVALVMADGSALTSRHFLDATPDGDLAEAAGMRFTSGFSEYGLTRFLGVSPLPRVHGVSPDRIMETASALAADADLEALRRRHFGDRAFLDLERGIDYVLIGPPHLGLAFQRWRERAGLVSRYPLEADGFNIAVLGPETTSWNGLLYFSEDIATLLRLSREGADDFFRQEARHFERFLKEGLGWKEARVELPEGVYVRQTRHALGTRHRLTLDEIASNYAQGSVGTFCYYPDFRGFRAVSVPNPLTAHVILEAGLFRGLRNLGIASRAGGYTPFAHSLCRLVQYNVTLGTALGVAAALTDDDLGALSLTELRAKLFRQGILADDPAGLERNMNARIALKTDPILTLETE